MAQVRWTLTSQRDLKDIEDWIARDSVRHAVRFVDRLIRAVENLEESPRLGRIVPEFGRPEIRELIVPPYRIVYWVQRRSVSVLRVVHGAREMKDLGSGRTGASE